METVPEYLRQLVALLKKKCPTTRVKVSNQVIHHVPLNQLFKVRTVLYGKKIPRYE